MDSNADSPAITFYKVFSQARSPRRADRTLYGAIPARAQRFCEPVKAATGFGWHVYSPIDFELFWDGSTIHWRPLDGVTPWSPLDNAHYPEIEELWARTEGVPDGFDPMLFMAAPPTDPGFVQIWTGLYVRTAPGWSTLIRGPANFPVPKGYDVLEGIVETDWWTGPLFTQVRMTRTNMPVRIIRATPLFHVQLVPRVAYSDEHLDDFKVVDGVERFSSEEWESIEAATAPRNVHEERAGFYQREVRRRQAQAAGADPPVSAPSPPG